MRGIRFGITLLALVLAWSGLMAGNNAMAQTPEPDEPEEPASITVHGRLCEGQPIDDWYDACHESPLADTFFAAINTDTGESVEGTTGPNGDVVLEVAPGTWQISGPPGDALENMFVFCSYGDATGENLGNPVTVGSGEAIVCDYYVVPADGSGDGPGIPTTPATVNVNLCIAAGCTELPEAIEPVDGVEVAFTNVDNDTEIDTCTSGDSGSGTCDVDIPEVSEVSVMVNPNTIPDGYMIEPNSSVYEWDPGNPEFWILLYPIDGLPPGDDATPAPTEVPPVPLPVPLALEIPSALYEGRCEDVENAESIEELNDLTIVEGDAQGASDALVAASGYTNVPMTINDLLTNDYSVVVFSEDDAEAIIACGEIGGVPDRDGAISVGLTQVDDSGAAGVAYLAPGEDARTTDVSNFLVPEGLIPEEEGTPEPLG